MRRLDRPTWLTLATVAVLALVLVASLALGADTLSLIVGATSVAAAFVIVVLVWLVPLRRAARQERKRQRQAAARAEQRAREQRSAADRRAAAQEARASRAANQAERRLLNRLEARDWLIKELELPRPLPPTRAYAASPDLLLELVQAVDRSAPEHVVELGGGVSSIVLARRLAQHGRGLLTTLEHQAPYAAATRAELAAYGVAERARVIEAPLVEVELADERWPWYTLGPEVPQRIDMLVVDGPPGTTRPQARYPALPLLRERLAPGALVLLDDTDREHEQEIVRRWLEEIEGLEQERLTVAHGATLLVYRG